MPERAFAEDQAVHDSRIGLEPHVLLQSIEENTGDVRPFVGLARLLLDDRSESDHFTGRFDGKIWRTVLPDFVDYLGLRLCHPSQDRLPCVAPFKIVGIRHQRAFPRILLDVADQNVVVPKTLNDLLARETFRNRELVPHHAVSGEQAFDLVHAHACLELIFAALENISIAVEQGKEAEPCRVVDDAGAFELLGDAAAIVFANDIDDLVRRQRTGLSRLHHQPSDGSDRQ